MKNKQYSFCSGEFGSDKKSRNTAGAVEIDPVSKLNPGYEFDKRTMRRDVISFKNLNVSG